MYSLDVEGGFFKCKRVILNVKFFYTHLNELNIVPRAIFIKICFKIGLIHNIDILLIVMLFTLFEHFQLHFFFPKRNTKLYNVVCNWPNDMNDKPLTDTRQY